MKKSLCAFCLLFFIPFVACTSLHKQPLPEGIWKCDELQAYFMQTGYGKYEGVMGEERKAFQMKVAVYGNECDFFYSDDPLPFLTANYRIKGNQMFLYQGGRLVYTFCRIDEGGLVRLQKGRTEGHFHADLRCAAQHGLRQPEPRDLDDRRQPEPERFVPERQRQPHDDAARRRELCARQHNAAEHGLHLRQQRQHCFYVGWRRYLHLYLRFPQPAQNCFDER